MRIRLARIREQLRASYWFVPGLMVIAAAGAAAALLALDSTLREQTPLAAFYPIIAEAEGARIVLSTISGSVITVAGVIFSITIAVLIMASAQFGPRLLRNFMQHLGTQFVLGTLVATFIYCLIVLVAIRAGEQPFVPQRSITAGVLLGILSVAALIYFIHHIALFIQVPRIVNDVATKLENALRAHFPERPPDADLATPDEEKYGAHRPSRDRADGASGTAICARLSGYVQGIDYDELVRIAATKDLELELEVRAGHLVLAGRPIMRVVAGTIVDPRIEAQILGTFVIGHERTPTQDPEFAVNQLVEVALRALSPGINDSFTAIDCIDRLGAALAVLATRDLPSRYLHDSEGTLRLVTNPITYHGIVDAAFDQIRQNARSQLAVMLRLIAVLHALGRAPLPEPFREALREQARSMYELRQELTAECDRVDFDSFYRGALQVLEAGPEREGVGGHTRSVRPGSAQ